MRPAALNQHNPHSVQSLLIPWPPKFSEARRILQVLPTKRISSFAALSSSSSVGHRPLRYAVLGAGFAGLSVVWHLLRDSPIEMHFSIDIFDEIGIGGGASGVAGGLLHPYNPKVKLLWKGAECWKESLKLLKIAEEALASKCLNLKGQELNQSSRSFIIRRGILRPAVGLKNLNVLTDNAQNCLAACRIETINQQLAQGLVPNVYLPHNLAFYMPEALNVNPQHYLEALYLGCQTLVKELSGSPSGGKKLSLHKKSVNSLCELSGDYDAVVICFGARAAFLPELIGKLPLRTCRGVIAHLQLPDIREAFPEHSPSILSDAWLAIKGSCSLQLGSTWDWKSTNYSKEVSAEEACTALEQLSCKASVVYPSISKWVPAGASAGLRAMPPLTPNGSLPLMGCIDDFWGRRQCSCKYWLLTGLGSRGLLFHGLLGKLMAQAVLSCNESLIPSELVAWRTKDEK